MVWMNGNFIKDEEAKISVWDHGLLYGDGIFEGIRIYNNKIFKLHEHVIRLFDSAIALRLDIPYTPEHISSVLEEGCRVYGQKEGYIRLVITRGVGTLGLDPDKCETPNVFMIFSTIQLYPKEYYEKGIPVVTAATRRPSSDVLDPRVKSLNYLNNIMAKIEAKQAGCMEAILLNKEGYVVECTADNIFVIRDGIIKTPDLSLGALGGITRATILEIAREEGLPFRETNLTRYDLYTADEIFMTGSGAELMPITAVDGRDIPYKKDGLTKRLHGKFVQKVNE
ncbi:branched-chain-amino-acid transaminase [Spirochaeta cellobiosiphila]|uniref:branched-chain-amino-acid transaminase n=1 Tax=Spirochaeta cellobiosiphila TaxID=504483 RepID=UPI0004085A6E|nr:branched-chain-amino-acid transaminase [Spirochaeta cellobiosiphila]